MVEYGVVEKIGDLKFKFNRSVPTDIFQHKKTQEEKREETKEFLRKSIEMAEAEKANLIRQYEFMVTGDNIELIPDKITNKYQTFPEWWDIIREQARINVFHQLIQMDERLRSMKENLDMFLEQDKKVDGEGEENGRREENNTN